ncbi:CBS domain-containing protein [Parapedobacter tibetensis]|uniref:CBS domain-containing protein n=1 Tax=Parapedobacter tibetensis TaxID=2972951 RepID=UPI00214D82CF|nr:CBS domain-containing protein [Parapedobacter tibetensis]
MGKVRNILETKGNAGVFVSPDTNVFTALELMFEKNIGALLVLEHGKFIGIFTERDYARKVILRGKSSKKIPIKEIMTTDPPTVSSDTTIEECMWLMTNRFIRHLPVIDDGKLMGIISIGDVVKFIIEEQKFIIKNLECYITGSEFLDSDSDKA